MSRRKPEVFSARAFTHLAVDLQDEAACAQAFGGLTHVTHVVYTAVYEMPGLIPGWSDPRQMETNRRMIDNTLEPLLGVARLQHVTLLQGTKAYGMRPTRDGDGIKLNPMRIPARERKLRSGCWIFAVLRRELDRDQGTIGVTGIHLELSELQVPVRQTRIRRERALRLLEGGRRVAR